MTAVNGRTSNTRMAAPGAISALLRRNGFDRSRRSSRRIHGSPGWSAGYRVTRRLGESSVHVTWEPGSFTRAPSKKREDVLLTRYASAIGAAGYAVDRERRETLGDVLIVTRSQDAPVTTTRAGRPANPVTAEMFAELVAQLRGGGRAVPRPRWLSRRVNLREAAELTGLAYNSLRRYRAQGAQRRAAGTSNAHLMPAEHPDGGWVIGDLARWRAAAHEGHIQGAARGFGQGGRWPGWETYLPQLRKYVEGLDGRPVSVTAAADVLGVERTLARKLLREIKAIKPRTTDADAMPFLTELAARSGRRFMLRDVLDALDDAGMRMGTKRAGRLYLAAGGRLPDEGMLDGPERAAAESIRWDGLFTAADIARLYEVSEALMTKSRRPRSDGLPPLIKPVIWENGKPLYDKNLLTRRKDLLAGPVNKGHPLAAELGAHRQLLEGIAHDRAHGPGRQLVRRTRDDAPHRPPRRHDRRLVRRAIPARGESRRAYGPQ